MLRPLHPGVKRDTLSICLSSYSKPKAVGGAREASVKSGDVTCILVPDLDGTTSRQLLELCTEAPRVFLHARYILMLKEPAL